MKNNVFKLTLLITLITNTIFAQTKIDETSAKNAIYVNAGSFLFYNVVNLNYDFRIKKSENGFFKNYYATMEAGVFNVHPIFSPGYSRKGFITGIGLIGLTGKGNRHFETSLGVSINIETELYSDDPYYKEGEGEVFTVPELSLGYRYQKANGFMFRAGIGFLQAVYIGAGYSF